VGHNSVADNTGLSSFFVAIFASETQEMSRISKRIWPYRTSRSSKVIGDNGKHICDFLKFLLVINCSCSRICYRFRDIHA